MVGLLACERAAVPREEERRGHRHRRRDLFPRRRRAAEKNRCQRQGRREVSVAMVRDFAHVIDREKAAIGFFVTLTDPTRNMVTEGVGGWAIPRRHLPALSFRSSKS